MYWDEKTETLKGKELRELQLKRLKWTIKQSMNVDFYKKKLKSVEVHGDDIKSLDDVKKLPFTYKTDLRSGYPFGFFAVPMRQIVRIHTTSGTTGKPTVVGYTKSDIDIWSDLIARNLTMVGLNEDDVF